MPARICWRACTIAGCCAWCGARPAPGSTRRSSSRRRTTAPRPDSRAPASCWQLYAPLPAASLGYLGGLLRYGVPHLAAEARQVQERAKSRYAHAQVDGLLWFWPQGEKLVAARHPVDERLCFLAPFDPVVWDRRRFQLFWGWEYKLEAYVPAHKRRLGHYAMPMLWGEQILGWANLKVVDRRLQHELGFAGLRPRGSAFRLALDEALQQMQEFLEL